MDQWMDRILWSWIHLYNYNINYFIGYSLTNNSIKPISNWEPISFSLMSWPSVMLDNIFRLLIQPADIHFLFHVSLFTSVEQIWEVFSLSGNNRWFQDWILAKTCSLEAVNQSKVWQTQPVFELGGENEQKLKPWWETIHLHCHTLLPHKMNQSSAAAFHQEEQVTWRYEKYEKYLCNSK